MVGAWLQVEVRAALGDPVPQPHPVHIERHNGVLRDRLAGLTRKTHDFAKCPTIWDAAVGLALFLRNWMATSGALRQPLPQPSGQRSYHDRPPAMVLGLTDHVWSLTEFLTHPVYP